VHPLLVDLNDAQRQVVLHFTGPLMVSAVAGSGKTTAMCRRIAYLIKVRHIDAYNILATTFTRKAAAHMNRKLAELKVHHARVGTLHSVAYEILRRDGSKYQGRFKLKDKVPLPPRAVIAERWQATQDEIRSFVGWCKNFLLTPRASETAPPIVDYIQRNYNSDRDDRGVRHVTRLLYAYGCYERRRIKRKLLTYDDILCQCHQLLQEQPRIAAKWRARYRYIIIDEVQDTCLAQHEIIQLLATPRNNLVVVGDVDQSVYGFRGALPQFMLDFPQRYHAPVVYMNSNYRSVPAVCTAAAKLIAHNQQRLPTTLAATRPALGTAAVTVTYVLNEDDEGRHVAHLLQRWHQRYAWKDLAVLCRTNYQCQSLEAELLYAHIPYRLVSGTVLLGRKVVAALLEYLKLGQSLHWGHIDFDAVIETINLPKRGVGPAFVRQLEEATSHKQQDPEAAILKLAKPKQRVSLDTYLDLAHRIAASIRKHQRPATILAWVADEVELIKIYNDAKRRKRAITAIDTLLLLAQRFRSTKRFLRWVDDTMLDNPDADADDLEDEMNPPDKVVISTIHRAKGLEFNAVALPFWTEAKMPHTMGSVEEERRLAYVAVTRAKDCAAVSCVRPLGNEDEVDASGPSRFLAEMGLAATPV
jgi:DNA helicase-2/ATP-dependent DNA helicase PcrA